LQLLLQDFLQRNPPRFQHQCACRNNYNTRSLVLLSDVGCAMHFAAYL
jgi:hypothetical protein